MRVLTDEVLDTLSGGKSEYMPVTLKAGVAKVVKGYAKEKGMSKSDAINRIVAEWRVIRKQAEAEVTELA